MNLQRHQINTAVECSATAITPIQYTLGGGATGATISWDVDPVSITLDAATTTISGTAPTVTTSTTYTYTLTSTGGSCPDTATGTITVNPDDEISLTSANSSQTGLCEGEAIQDITYALAGGATGVTVSGFTKWRNLYCKCGSSYNFRYTDRKYFRIFYFIRL